jgi:hypothetical protein
MNWENLIKLLLLLLAMIISAEALVLLLYGRKKFTCKMCGRFRRYDEMYSVTICKRCSYGR